MEKSNIAAFIMIIVASTLLGASMGIVIAEPGILSDLKKTGKPEQLAGNIVTPAASAKPEIPKPEVPPASTVPSTVLSTGLSPMGTIEYSPQLDSASLTFDLEGEDLIQTGKLSGPDRIYVDLQDHRMEPGTPQLLKAQKKIGIDGDLVTGVRIAQWDTGAMRIVLDLKHPCSFTYRISPGPHSRLIIELRPSA